MDNPELFFRNLCITALADKRFRQAEKQVLIDFAKKLRLSRAQAGAILREIKESPTQPVSLPNDKADRHSLFDAMLKVCVADELMAPEELILLRKIGVAIGLTVEEINQRVDDAFPRSIQAPDETQTVSLASVKVTAPASASRYLPGQSPKVDSIMSRYSEEDLGPQPYKMPLDAVHRAGFALLCVALAAIFYSILNILALIELLKQQGLSGVACAKLVGFTWRVISILFLGSAGMMFVGTTEENTVEFLHRGFRHLASGLIAGSLLGLVGWITFYLNGINVLI